MESKGKGCGGGKPHHYLSMVSTKSLSRCQKTPNTAGETPMKANSGDLKLAYVNMETSSSVIFRASCCFWRLSLNYSYLNKRQDVPPRAIGWVSVVDQPATSYASKCPSVEIVQAFS